MGYRHTDTPLYRPMLQLFRFPNLLIVAITQYLLQYMVLVPSLQEAGLGPMFGFFHFSLLVLTTILIAAGGYIINDVIDYKTDIINKPDKVVVGKYLSKKTATRIYWLIVFLGGGVAWYLAGFINNQGLFLIYPFAVLLLYLYSFYLKKIPLWGNLAVALFCAGVAGVVLFSERAAFMEIWDVDPFLAHKIKYVFTGYIVFAFVSTFLREIIKDIEDMEGDKKTGLRTYPVVYGIRSAKKLSILVSVTLVAGLVIGLYWLAINKEWAGVLFSFLFLILPLTFLMNFLKKSEIKPHFSALSKLTKGVMLSGLLLLIVIWKF